MLMQVLQSIYLTSIQVFAHQLIVISSLPHHNLNEIEILLTPTPGADI